MLGRDGCWDGCWTGMEWMLGWDGEENADATIEEMRGDRDPIIRYGAMYGLALAY